MKKKQNKTNKQTNKEKKRNIQNNNLIWQLLKTLRTLVKFYLLFKQTHYQK